MSTPPTPWEIFKPLLIGDSIHGRISATMKPRDVYNFRDEYRLVNKVNFCSNLQNHRNGLDVLRLMLTIMPLLMIVCFAQLSAIHQASTILVGTGRRLKSC
jgi:hypothetical protein